MILGLLCCMGPMMAISHLHMIRCRRQCFQRGNVFKGLFVCLWHYWKTYIWILIKLWGIKKMLKRTIAYKIDVFQVTCIQNFFSSFWVGNVFVTNIIIEKCVNRFLINIQDRWGMIHGTINWIHQLGDKVVLFITLHNTETFLVNTPPWCQGTYYSVVSI